MTTPAPRPPRAAGIFLTLGALVGSIGGIALGEPSLGLLAGLAAGGLVVLAFWLSDSKHP